MHTHIVLVTLTAASFLFPFAGLTAEIHTYPAEGQNEEQQQRDQWACHQWAVEKTGVNPLAMAKQETAPPAKQTESVATGMRKGIFHGLIAGAIRGGDFARTTPMGAGIGALIALRRHRKAMEEQHDAYEKAYETRAQKLETYDSAYGACMKGRGYTVS